MNRRSIQLGMATEIIEADPLEMVVWKGEDAGIHSDIRWRDRTAPMCISAMTCPIFKNRPLSQLVVFMIKEVPISTGFGYLLDNL